MFDVKRCRNGMSKSYIRTLRVRSLKFWGTWTVITAAAVALIVYGIVPLVKWADNTVVTTIEGSEVNVAGALLIVLIARWFVGWILHTGEIVSRLKKIEKKLEEMNSKDERNHRTLP